MPPDTVGGLDAQQALAAWIRDPEHSVAPEGIEPRRLRVYADLVHRGLTGMLGTTFPVMRAVLGDTGWHALVRDFLREHGARSPVFTDLPRELLRYLDARAARGAPDAPWLRELAHYEWIELALQIDGARATDIACDVDGDLRTGMPVLSPLAWTLAYDWPVHRIAPDALPDAPEPTFLLVHRRDDGEVDFHALAPLAFHLLERVAGTTLIGDALLRTLARDVGADDVDAFVDAGLALLDGYRRDGIVLGTRSA